MLKSLVLSCEHASQSIPAQYREEFEGHARLLNSHRGWDPGSLAIAQALAKRFRAPLIAARFSRLLVDANRSPHRPEVFSEITRRLPEGERQRLLQEWHAPHWSRVRGRVQEAIESSGRAVHLAVHSFTPVLNGQRRNADLGLLYDPRRGGELALALALQRRLRQRCAVRRNYPYRGVADGLPTALRKELSARTYLGIELELNQAWLTRLGVSVASDVISEALSTVLDGS